MARLTNAIRKEIVNAALEKSKFPARIQKLKDQRNDWLFGLLMEAFGGKQKYLDLLREKKAAQRQLDWLNNKVVGMNYRLQAQTGSTGWYMNFNGARFTQHDMKYPKEFAERHESLLVNGTLDSVLWPKDRFIAYAADSDQVAVFWKFENDLKALESSQETIKANVEALVQSVTTVKKLIQVWPECEELIPKVDEPTVIRNQLKRNLPAINMASLNAAIGIPSPEA